MKPIIDQLAELLQEVRKAKVNLDLGAKQQQLMNLTAAMQAPDFWSNPTNAEQISTEAAALKREITNWDTLEDDLATTLELVQLEEAGEPTEFTDTMAELKNRTEQALIAVKLSGEFDSVPAIMQLSAGVGGTDAQDWAEMLLTMYLKYAEKSNLHAEIVERSDGEEAGIKSATVEFRGPYAFGKLKSEKGVHRLVRLSPFNADNLRQTSFALVDVVPEISESAVTIDDKDLKVDTYRSSGHGGQSVNTTDSAVRITHLPTGTVVAIQNERSQLKNKQKAMAILASKLAELAREQHLESVAELRGKLKSADWGAQIRSYVLQPYTKVKDHRTDYETSDAQGVLAGKLDGFIEAYLNWQLKNKQ